MVPGFVQGPKGVVPRNSNLVTLPGPFSARLTVLSENSSGGTGTLSLAMVIVRYRVRSELDNSS